MFVTAFGAATLLPFGSEAVFLAYLLDKDILPLWLIIAASSGNILGGVFNYWCGIKIIEGNTKFKMVKAEHLSNGTALFEKYGAICLLFSWAPVVGDAFTVIAGMSRYSYVKFFILMAIGKILRFLFLWASFIGLVKLWG